MDASPLILGLSVEGVTLGSNPQPNHPGNPFESCRSAYAASTPTSIVSWPQQTFDGRSALSAAVGCDEGSCYIFEPKSDISQAESIPTPVIAQPRPVRKGPGSPQGVASPIPSRFKKSPSPTPSGTSLGSGSRFTQHSYTPSLVSARRASFASPSLSKAQVEAPKLHVDYDNEAENLRSMLKTNRTDGYRRASNATSSTTESEPTSPTTTTTDDGVAQSLSAVSPQLLTSPETLPLPPTLYTRSSSSRSDPTALPDLQLRLRILPPRIGFGHGVSCLKLLEGNSILACLQESGYLSLFSTTDGRCIASSRIDQDFPRIKPPIGCKPIPAVPPIFLWKNMRVAQDGQSTLLFLAAQAVEPDGSHQLRITVIRVLSAYERAFTSEPDDITEKVGDWLTDGSTASCVGLHLDTKGELSIYRVTSDSHLIFQPVQFLPHPPSPSASTLGPEDRIPGKDELSGFLQLPLSQSLNQIGQQLKLPNPFSRPSHSKSLSFRYSRYRTIPKSFSSAIIEEQNLNPSRVELGDEVDAGVIEWGSGMSEEQVIEISGLTLATFANGTKVMGCAWSLDRCSVFRLETRNRKKVRTLTNHSADGIQHVSWLSSDTYALSSFEEVQVYRVKTTDANNDDVPGDAWFLDESIDVIHRSELTAPFPQEGEITVSCLISPSMLLVSCRNPVKGNNEISVVNLPANSRSKALSRKSTRRKGTQIVNGNRRLWDSGPKNTDPTRVHAVLPLGFDTVILGLGDGRIAKATMEELFVQRFCPLPSGSAVKASSGLEWPIISLERVKNNRTEEEFIVGGSFEGSVAVWNLSDLQLRARWTVFATPLLSVIDLSAEEEHAGRLKDCILCIAEHGTIAVISVDSMQLLYLIPGATSPLERLCLGEDNLLLIYADASKARLWDLKTQEFWRSMTKVKAEELLEQGGWFEVYVEHEGPRFTGETCFGYTKNVLGGNDIVFIDVGELIRTGMNNISKKPSSPLAATDLGSPAILKAWMYLHPILFACLAMQIGDPDFDELCLGLLGSRSTGVVPACSLAGYKGAITLSCTPFDRSAWTRSSEYNSALLLAILSLLKAGSSFEEWDSLASQISTYLINNLYQIVGDGFKSPSLEALTSHWFNSCSEVKQAARSLFGAQVERLSEKQACDIVDEGRYRLPSVQPESLKDAPYSATALVVVGHVAAEHYTSISTETLTDVAKSVALYLHDESSPHRVLAIELCSIGFHVWQHYVDAVNVLRALFELATTSPAKKEGTGVAPGSTSAVGPQARSAVLQIASTNTPLFMTTLTMDIANPKSVEHRRSVMQLIAFIIKKKPLVLYPNLTRLVEAVIKSLDPNIAANREAVMDPAVEILGHVVRTFPTVDFHKATQRLALGTNEGAVIMYDLKTATRLYVLEGHKKRLTAVSFSPDGRRLVTASLDESVVMVWKVGSSFTSFFNPGAPPRQGGTGTEAYKVYPFNVGDEARMTVAGTLDWVAFEWTNDRTARLKIRDSALTFATT